MNVEPMSAPFVAIGCLALSDLVGVVRERIVYATAMEIDILAKVLPCYARTFNVPAGIANAPGGIPFQLLVLKLGFGEPKNKVGLVALVGVLLYAVAYTNLKILLLEIVEYIILFKLGGIKIDISSRLVCVTLFKESFDHSDKLRYAVGSGLDDLRALDVELVAIGEERIGVVLGNLKNRFMLTLCALEHLVLTRVAVAGKVTDVGDVHYSGYVVSEIAEIFFKHVLHCIRTKIAYMGKMINSGAAGVHSNLALYSGLELILGSGK